MNDFETPPGATPLSPDESEGLLLKHIATRGELDRWEQDNMNDAIEWISRRRKTDVLSEQFIRRLHRHMFGRVWKWAGEFRRSDKNIGVHWAAIPVEVKKLLDDVRYWIERHSFAEDEIAVRFHHKLVWIHLFANGNGRHARLATDVLLKEELKQLPFSWGRGAAKSFNDLRAKYIAALREADGGSYEGLLEFVRQ